MVNEEQIILGMNSSPQLAAVHSVYTLLRFHTRRRLVIHQKIPRTPSRHEPDKKCAKKERVRVLLVFIFFVSVHLHSVKLQSDFIGMLSGAVWSDLFRLAISAN